MKIKDLLIGYRKSSNEKVVAGPVNLTIASGEFVCLIGQNGSGKTTLLKTLAGVHKPIKGNISINSQPLENYKPSELSKILSVVLTEKISVGNLNVYALVSLGRFPYTNWLGGLKERDKEIIEWALEITDTKKFKARQLGELSDGELQKVMIARALAQDTDIILLDEPTAHLDLPNRIDIFLLLRKLAHQTKKLILVSTHELDLALQAADKIWLIQLPKNQSDSSPVINQIFSGAPEDMVLKGDFERAFEKHEIIFDKKTGRFKINTSAYKAVNLKGPEVPLYWTTRALERAGFKVDNNFSSSIQIEIDEGSLKWFGKINGENFLADSIEELLKQIQRRADPAF